MTVHYLRAKAEPVTGPLIKVPEAAKRLGISVSTVRRMIAARRLRAVNLMALGAGTRGLWRVVASDVDRLLLSKSEP